MVQSRKPVMLITIKNLEIYGCDQCRFMYANETGEHFCIHGKWDDADGRILPETTGKKYIFFPDWCPLPNATELSTLEKEN
jgi:hypothetical protein